MNRTALPVRRERSRNNRNRTQISASTGLSAPLENPRGHRPTIDKDGPTAATFHTLATALTKPMRAHPSTPSHQPARNNPDEAAPPHSTRRAAAARRRVLRRRGPKNTRDGSSDNGGSARQPGTGYAHHRTHHDPSRQHNSSRWSMGACTRPGSAPPGPHPQGGVAIARSIHDARQRVADMLTLCDPTAAATADITAFTPARQVSGVLSDSLPGSQWRLTLTVLSTTGPK